MAYDTTVWVPSAHVTSELPLVVLLAQLPLPEAIGSWYVTVSVAPVLAFLTFG